MNADELFGAAHASIKIFQFETKNKKSFRKIHDELRKIWRQCSLSKPTAKIIKGLALKLSEEGFYALRRRGDYLFNKENGKNFTRDNFNEWLKKVRKKGLIRFLMHLIAEARKTYLRSVISQIEIGDQKIRIIGNKSNLAGLIVGQTTQAQNVSGFVRKWRAQGESNPCFRRERATS